MHLTNLNLSSKIFLLIFATLNKRAHIRRGTALIFALVVIVLTIPEPARAGMDRQWYNTSTNPFFLKKAMTPLL